MSSKKSRSKRSVSKKAINQEIEESLLIALESWREKLGEKKFRKRITKAAGIISKNLNPKKKQKIKLSKKKVVAPRAKEVQEIESSVI